MIIRARGNGPAVFVLDDDALVRATLSHLMSTAGYEVTFCANHDALLALCRETTPACILLDLVLPGASGVNVLKELRRFQVFAPILMISGQADIDSAVSAMKEGAFDFVEKPFRGPDLLSRVKAAIDEFGRQKRKERDLVLDAHRTARLTAREEQILDKLAAGLSSKQVARALHLSSRTVEGHRAKIMRKLGARNAADLIRIALTAKIQQTAESVREQET